MIIQKLRNFLGFNNLKNDLNLIKLNQGKILINQNSALKQDEVNNHEYKIFSQFGEDSIIQFLINNLNISKNLFIEIGVENYEEANTRFLLENNNWEGLIIDGSDKNIKFVREQNYYWRNKIKAVSRFVSTDNINEIILDNKFRDNIGILSIDIDGNDYWLWESINVVSPDILIIEYNANFGSKKSLTIKYDENFQRSKKGLNKLIYGASLSALYKLAKKKNYSLVLVNSNGNNAFFVRDNLLNSNVSAKTVEECFKKNTFKEFIDEKDNFRELEEEQIKNIIEDLRIVEVKPTI